MKKNSEKQNKRILVVDDDEKIWNVYKRVLSLKKTNKSSALHQITDLLENDPEKPKPSTPYFDLKWASQGQIGVECVETSLEQKSPYAVAFVDVRMPPGWDGMETAKRIRQLDPNIELVIVTAYSDRSREEIVGCRNTGKITFSEKAF